VPDSVAILWLGPPKKMEIPKGKFTLHTANSVYLLGRANKKGERSIARLSTDANKHPQPLEFTRCKIEDINAQRMNVDCLDGPEHLQKNGWHTGNVLEIRKVK